MKNDMKQHATLFGKILIYSSIFFGIFQLFEKFYINLISKGMVFLYLIIKNLPYLDVPLKVYLKMEPSAPYFGLIFATPDIKFSKRIKFALFGLVVFYVFDVVFAVAQLFDLTLVLALEYFIRFVSIILIWIVFSYDDYLKKMFKNDKN